MAIEGKGVTKKWQVVLEILVLIVGLLVTIITLIDFIESKFSVSIIGDRIFSFCLLIVSTTAVSILVTHLRHFSMKKPSGDSGLVGSFLDSISEAYKAEKWHEVIKIGSVLSRPLWLTGHYELRVKIGEYVESAAAFLKEDKIQATALIDDLGWTNVALGDLEKARSYIEHGMKIAQESKDYYYLVSKAYRHLSGIAIKKHNYHEAESMFTKAMEALLQLPVSHERKELEAGLLVNGAMLKLDQGRWSEALADLGQARGIYRDLSDEDREVKLYSLEGNCYLNMKEFDEALDSFRDGLAMAEKRCRKDAVISNLQGIGRVYESLGENEKAREHFKLALANAKELKDQVMIDELEKEVRRIDRAVQGVKKND